MRIVVLSSGEEGEQVSIALAGYDTKPSSEEAERVLSAHGYDDVDYEIIDGS